MITIITTTTGRKSVFICDYCEHPIYDATRAVAFIDSNEMKHAHKGNCHVKAAKEGITGFMELTEHLAQLQHNSFCSSHLNSA